MFDFVTLAKAVGDDSQALKALRGERATCDYINNISGRYRSPDYTGRMELAISFTIGSYDDTVYEKAMLRSFEKMFHEWINDTEIIETGGIGYCTTYTVFLEDSYFNSEGGEDRPLVTNLCRTFAALNRYPVLDEEDYYDVGREVMTEYVKNYASQILENHDRINVIADYGHRYLEDFGFSPESIPYDKLQEAIVEAVKHVARKTTCSKKKVWFGESLKSE